MELRTCVTCSTPFTPANVSQRYCGKACYYQGVLKRSRANRKAGQVTTRICAGCSTQMALIRTRGNLRRLCGTCRIERQRAAKRNERRVRDARKRGVHAELINPRDIYERDAWRCQLCHGPVPQDEVVPHPKAPTLDHVVPLAQGGDHIKANVQLAHFECNWRKGSGGTQQLALIG